MEIILQMEKRKLKKYKHSKKTGCCTIDDETAKLWECPHWLKSLEDMARATFSKAFNAPVKKSELMEKVIGQ